MTRRRLLAPLALLAFSGCGQARRIGPDPATARGPELNVMSFNIRYGTASDGENAWPERRDMVIRLIGRENPDIIGTQEALRFQLDEIRRSLPQYGEAGVGRDDGREAGEYAAILFRTERFELLGSGTFWLSATPDSAGSMTWGNRVTRICTWARLRDRQTGRRFSVWNVHLDHESQNARLRGVQLMLQRMQRREGRSEPIILTGDFNAGEQNPAVVEVRLAGFRDTFREAHASATTAGTFHAFRGDSTGDKIDYVFVPLGSATLDARILRDHDNGRYPSDHFPVVARVRLR
jgi:endonuclease/exonuclease/phosphatase family metal-dependent hydrolase